MAINENQTPTRKDKGKRASLFDLFPELKSISSPPISPSHSTPLSPSKKVLRPATFLRGSFRGGWPPSIRSLQGLSPFALEEHDSTVAPAQMLFTLRMSREYRIYSDGWRLNHEMRDEPANVTSAFKAAEDLVSEIADIVAKHESASKDLEDLILEEMVRVVFGSNNLERVGSGIDETLRLCLAVFNGEHGLEYTDRTAEYQARLNQFVLQNTNSGEIAVVRSRREVVQHAAALRHIVSVFVKEGKPMTEQLLKDTHAILVKGISAADAGIISATNFGGTYRRGDERAYVGATQFTRPADIPKAMRSLVKSLRYDIAEIEKTRTIDPWALASKYSDRLVNIHPFKDGNGRMCRLIMNAILMKYVGIVVALGERDENREQYISAALESTAVGGYPGCLATVVLENAGETLKRLKIALKSRSVKSRNA